MATGEFTPMMMHTSDSLLELLKRQNIQGAIVDGSGADVRFTLLCTEESLQNVTSEQIRFLHTHGKLPSALTRYLMQRGIID